MKLTINYIETKGFQNRGIIRDGGSTAFRKKDVDLFFYNTNRITKNPFKIVVYRDVEKAVDNFYQGRKIVFEGDVKTTEQFDFLLTMLNLDD